jgi:hypothetical protein
MKIIFPKRALETEAITKNLFFFILKHFHMKRKFLLLYAMMLMLTHLSIAQTIQGIIVDGGSAASDVTTNLYESRFREIATSIGYRMNIKRLKSSDGNVISTLNSITCGANDIFVVIYAGHGANADDGWPGFSTSDGGVQRKVGMSDVIDVYLNVSNARLKFIAYDCCNHGRTTRSPNVNQVAPPTSTIYRLLFKEAKGLIKTCSSDEGKYSWEAVGFGGFFSTSLLHAMEDPDCIGGNSQQTWQLVLEKAKKLTNDRNRNASKELQNPRFSILLGTSQNNSPNIPAPRNTPAPRLPREGLAKRNH